jgi:membrane associated rhomboid family serine protease
MGIYDREYYRGDRGYGAWVSPHRVCHWLIIVNVICFIIQMATRDQPIRLDGPFTNALDLNVDRVLHGQIWRLLTYAFLHSDDIWHILFNMLALWWFGRAIEDIYGPKEFLAFYLVSAVLSGLAHLGYEIAVHGVAAAHPAIGASGAVTAVMVVFAMHYPKTTVYLFFVIPVPIIAVIVLFIGLDMLGLIGARPGSNIAFAAHLGGALFGYLYCKFQLRLLRWWPTRMSMRPQRYNRPRLRVFREPDPDDTALSEAVNEEDERLEAQVDAVLDKVAKYGKSSLTDREHQLLLKASEVYKQRRK